LQSHLKGCNLRHWKVGATIWVVDSKGNGCEFVVDKVGRKYVTLHPKDDSRHQVVFWKDTGRQCRCNWKYKNCVAYSSRAAFDELQRIERETERLAVRLHGNICHWYCRQFQNAINGSIVDKLHKLLSEYGVPE